jgi:hypothetical protein
MTREERKVYFVEHLRDSILQADTITRYQAHALGRQWGWLSANDIRALENMNPVEGGDEYLVPLNMAPANEEKEQPDAKAQSGKERDAKEKQKQEKQLENTEDTEVKENTEKDEKRQGVDTPLPDGR